MTYPPHQFLTLEQQAKMDAHNAPPARTYKGRNMMDKELLELAAKAAGIEGDIKYTADDAIWLFHHGAYSPWNPLVDDGDALRLAVKLKIHISGFFDKVTTDTDEKSFCEMYKNDQYTATRRAIVRAAAEIGKAGSTHS